MHPHTLAGLAGTVFLAVTALAQTPTNTPSTPTATPSAPAPTSAPTPTLQRSASLATPAQPPPAPPSPDLPAQVSLSLEPSRFSVSLASSGDFFFNADLESGDGSLSVNRWDTDLTLAYSLSRSVQVTLALGSELSFYDIRSGEEFLAGSPSPISDAFIYNVSPGFRYAIDDTWSVIGGFTVQQSGEFDTDFDLGLTGGAFAAVRYKVSDTLAITAGLGGNTRLEDPAIVFPIIAVEWRITDRVRLTPRPLGIGLEADLDAAATLRATVEAGVRFREFRLAESNPLPSGIFTDTSVPIAFGLTWTPRRQFTLGVRGGFNVFQEIEIENSEGGTLSEIEIDPAPFVGVFASIGF